MRTILTMSRVRSWSVGILALSLLVVSLPAAAKIDDSTWYGGETVAEIEIHLYFGWSSTCPHCLEAKPFVEELASIYPWLKVHFLQLNEDPEAVELVVALAEGLGETAQYVPMFFYCKKMVTGFGSEETTGQELRDELLACRDARMAELPSSSTVPAASGSHSTEPATGDEEVVSLPLLGTIDTEAVSLPVFAVVLAGLDAFNPCAFFVLLFLLSLLVHARSRSRMALIGGTFVLISGVVYLAFMAAWLNLFLVMGALEVVTLIAGLVALAVAALNIKDYFWFQRGPSLSIPDSSKPGLFRRMRMLTTSSSFPAILAGTVTLAFAANAYELLCTAGFPMVFTRVLTLRELSTPTYYLYLVLYNVVYVVPLLAIVGVFVWTLGSRKLTERAGRVLKLLSGLMMLGLGLVLVFAHEALSNLLVAPLILLGAIVVTGVAVLVDRSRWSGHGRMRPARRA